MNTGWLREHLAWRVIRVIQPGVSPGWITSSVFSASQGKSKDRGPELNPFIVSGDGFTWACRVDRRSSNI